MSWKHESRATSNAVEFGAVDRLVHFNSRPLRPSEWCGTLGAKRAFLIVVSVSGCAPDRIVAVARASDYRLDFMPVAGAGN